MVDLTTFDKWLIAGTMIGGVCSLTLAAKKLLINGRMERREQAIVNQRLYALERVVSNSLRG